MNPTEKDLARQIDYALLAPEATRQDIEQHCAEARQALYHSVCVHGSRVELAYALLEESGVQVTALVGFPLGTSPADAKRYETEIAVDNGAQEIEFILNLGPLKDGDHRGVLRELRDIAEAADERLVTVVLETHLLTREEKVLACRLAVDSGVQCVCTSADFHAPVVSVDDVKLLRESVGENCGLKAAGAIRDPATALALLAAGATRIGTTTLIIGSAG